MKKILALILALCMVFAVAACGDKTDGGKDGATGSVYWLNFKPESDADLQKLAAMYTEKTGVPVNVVTAASGTYSQTLTAEMDKSTPPTLFVVGNQEGVKTWKDYCLDLKGTILPTSSTQPLITALTLRAPRLPTSSTQPLITFMMRPASSAPSATAMSATASS